MRLATMHRKGMAELTLWIIGGYLLVGLIAAVTNYSSLADIGIRTFSLAWWIEELAVMLFWPYALFARIFLPAQYSLWSFVNHIGTPGWN